MTLYLILLPNGSLIARTALLSIDKAANTQNLSPVVTMDTLVCHLGRHQKVVYAEDDDDSHSNDVLQISENFNCVLFNLITSYLCVCGCIYVYSRLCVYVTVRLSFSSTPSQYDGGENK